MLWSYFNQNLPTPPPRGIRIIPCTPVDVLSATWIITTGLIVDARLDARKLEDTLVMLIEKKFPRAGARVALRNGLYEFHVPESFGTDMPAVRFTVEDHAGAYHSDVTRPRLPRDLYAFKPASSPTISTLPDLSAYFQCAGPRTITEWVQSKSPLLHVHLSTFDDLTFIGVTSPHLGFDAMGTGILLQAWTDLMNGINLDDIAGMQWNAEPLKEFMPQHTLTMARPKFPKGFFDLGIFSRMWFVARLLWRELWDPKLVQAVVRVPKVFLADWKRQITEELKKEGSREWVSSSDILLAWFYKQTLEHSANDRKAIHLAIVSDLRTKPIFHNNAELGVEQYIGNMVLPIPVPPVPASTFRNEPLGTLALHLRRAINAFNTDLAELRNTVHWYCANPGGFPGPCPAEAEFRWSTSWKKAGFGSLDFSGAQVQVSHSPSSQSGQAKRASVNFVYPVVNQRPSRDGVAILMEDAEFIWVLQVSGAKELQNMRRRGNVLFV
ncbi:hypothetical protein FB45DRAFT_764832 [Roridomyces roridus]|uniref:Uncharacterized protein n=1 Tax=Roridomyces roridus TaxID=1738132 RepID=A0AAD7B1D7_9AGAR|nr:hypothetical protein FB45DRAFT_764832 [Roridomyces roridus]